MNEKNDNNRNQGPESLARDAIGRMLDGMAPSEEFQSEDLGKYAECYLEMLRAYAYDGTAAARQVFVAYADHDPEIASLRAGDPATKEGMWDFELQLMNFPEPIWTIPGFLPTGLTFLAGKPKVGKSWLALQLANAVGNGTELFGQSVVRKNVLYLALEDSYRRVQKRTLLQGFPRGQRTIKFMTEFPSLTHPHAFSLLRRVIEESNFQLVIIDTISKLLGDLDQNEGGTMNLIFSRLHSLAKDQMITILLVDHHRKGHATHADPIEDLLGSRAKSAVADCLMGLYRARNSKRASLHLLGREVEETMLSLQWDPESHCWQHLGDEEAVQQTAFEQEICESFAALKTLGQSATTANIATYVGKDRGQVNRALKRLIELGVVAKLPRDGREQPYCLVSEQ